MRSSGLWTRRVAAVVAEAGLRHASSGIPTPPVSKELEEYQAALNAWRSGKTFTAQVVEDAAKEQRATAERTAKEALERQVEEAKATKADEEKLVRAKFATGGYFAAITALSYGMVKACEWTEREQKHREHTDNSSRFI